MKAYHIFILAALLLGACRGGTVPVPATEQGREVDLSGAVGAPHAAPSRAWIVPDGGLPPRQLSIGVALVQYVTADPLADQPTEEDWNGATLLRAYFGGPDIAPDPTTFVPSNGEIKFTNNTGTRVQKVFYEELGAYSFMRAIYPYQGASVVPTVDGGVVVVPVDGSQDVMCSGWGWGSVLATHQPLINTNLAFGHLLTRINVRLVAESAPASGQYGDILGVSLSHQPGELAVNLIDGSVTGWSNNDQNYPLIGQPEVQTLNTAGVDYGYAMALPADSYEIRVETQNRRSFYPVAVLPAVPVGERRAGRVYDVVLSFKAADEIKIAVTDATEWWLDSTFD